MSTETIVAPLRARPPTRGAASEERMNAHEELCAFRYGGIASRLDRIERTIAKLAWAGWTILGGVGVLLARQFLTLIH